MVGSATKKKKKKRKHINIKDMKKMRDENKTEIGRLHISR